MCRTHFAEALELASAAKQAELTRAQAEQQERRGEWQREYRLSAADGGFDELVRYLLGDSLVLDGRTHTFGHFKLGALKLAADEAYRKLRLRPQATFHVEDGTIDERGRWCEFAKWVDHPDETRTPVFEPVFGSENRSLLEQSRTLHSSGALSITFDAAEKIASMNRGAQPWMRQKRWWQFAR